MPEALIAISASLYPTLLIINVVAAEGTESLNAPNESVLVPPLNPLVRTLAFQLGAPEVESTTLPVTVLLVWAFAAEKKKIQHTKHRNGNRRPVPDNLLKILIILVLVSVLKRRLNNFSVRNAIVFVDKIYYSVLS